MWQQRLMFQQIIVMILFCSFFILTCGVCVKHVQISERRKTVERMRSGGEGVVWRSMEGSGDAKIDIIMSLECFLNKFKG